MIKPLANKLLVERLLKRVHRSGLHLPDSVNNEFAQDSREFRVLAVGPKVKDINPGDRILCQSHFSGPIPFDKSERRFITDDQVLLKIVDDQSGGRIPT